MKKNLSKIARGIHKIPERKHYIEFLTAVLSVPVLLTVILLNVNNLSASKKEAASPIPVREIIVREASSSNKTPEPSESPSTTPSSTVCKKDIGPLSIISPKEGETVTDNPVNFVIRYEDKSYCSVVWSYRINNGSWSEYNSNSPSIFNMPDGSVKFELRVQSTVTDDQTVLQRNFEYQGANPSPTLSVTNQTPTPTQ